MAKKTKENVNKKQDKLIKVAIDIAKDNSGKIEFDMSRINALENENAKLREALIEHINYTNAIFDKLAEDFKYINMGYHNSKFLGE